MKNKGLAMLLIAMMTAMTVFSLTGQTESVQEADETEMITESEEKGQEALLEDGYYMASFDTDNGMFRINEVYEGKGLLTVENGEMTIHLTLLSKNIVQLYPGLKEDAKKDGAQLLDPTLDTVTYSDGYTEQVYGFNVPVTVLDETFDLALIGKKDKWYDHKVTVSDPEPIDEAEAEGIIATWEEIE